MMIPVMLKNGDDEIVFPKVLDELLDSGQVMFFKRSGSWVVVGRDPVRGTKQSGYKGKERRIHHTKNLLH